MRRLNGLMLQVAMQARGWKAEDFVRELKARKYDVPCHIVQKWCKGKNQPSAERVELIEATLGYCVTDAPPPRRQFRSSTSLSQTPFA